jgi:hypothetical protein
LDYLDDVIEEFKKVGFQIEEHNKKESNTQTSN